MMKLVVLFALIAMAFAAPASVIPGADFLNTGLGLFTGGLNTATGVANAVAQGAAGLASNIPLVGGAAQAGASAFSTATGVASGVASAGAQALAGAAGGF